MMFRRLRRVSVFYDRSEGMSTHVLSSTKFVKHDSFHPYLPRFIKVMFVCSTERAGQGCREGLWIRYW